MDELTRAPERILIDCFTALDAGASNDDCFARYPQQADRIRGVLDMRAQLLTLKTTAPSPATFASGREALLARVVRPLASSYPGSLETEGRQARGLISRPATRAAFAGALLFAMASCAIGVSATPAGDRVSDVLPDVPAIDMPDQRPIYPFPELNDAPPGLLPTAEPEPPDAGAPIEPTLQPATEPADVQEETQPGDEKPGLEQAKPSSPGNTWLPPTNAEESDTPTDVTTPTVDDTVTPEPDESDDNPGNQHSSDDGNASNTNDGDSSDGDGSDDGGPRDHDTDSSNGNESDNNGHQEHGGDGNGSAHGEISGDAAPSS